MGIYVVVTADLPFVPKLINQRFYDSAQSESSRSGFTF
jgi:hypothetical protein